MCIRAGKFPIISGDILAAIAEIEEFSFDRKTTNAVIRSLEVLGEATKHIPSSFRNKHSEIPWSKMAGLRDVLIHDYMGVDLKTVWKVIQERLPELKIMLSSVFKDNF
ncbi:MAG: DUF86 domain-containing protein [Desulfocapsa sp.]|nr:DUF86 domain-containing protein [Desulfocapsa sp.]